MKNLKRVSNITPVYGRPTSTSVTVTSARAWKKKAVGVYENALELNPENTELSDWLKEHSKTS